MREITKVFAIIAGSGVSVMNLLRKFSGTGCVTISEQALTRVLH